MSSFVVLPAALCVAKSGEEPLWSRIQRLADERLTDAQKWFLLAVAALQGSIILARVARALERGDVAAAESEIDWSLLPAQEIAVKELLFGLMSEAGAATSQTVQGLAFDSLHPRAVEWAKIRAGELIRQITEETRAAIRSVIADSLQQGANPYSIAARVKQYIGLTERQMKAVENLRRRLISEGNQTMAQINELSGGYARRLLDYRAETIARTETMEAVSEGSREAWRQAAEQGLISELEYEREWVVTEDDRTCEECLAMDGKRAPIGGTYEDGSAGPPLHPNCRCAEVVSRKKG